MEQPSFLTDEYEYTEIKKSSVHSDSAVSFANDWRGGFKDDAKSATDAFKTLEACVKTNSKDVTKVYGCSTEDLGTQWKHTRAKRGVAGDTQEETRGA